MTETDAKASPARLGGDAVLVLDRSLRIMGANEAACKTLGPELTPGQVFRVENFFQGPSAARAQADLDQALSSESRPGRSRAAWQRLADPISPPNTESPRFSAPPGR